MIIIIHSSSNILIGGVCNGKDCLSSSVEFSELVASPRLDFWVVVFQVADSFVRIISLFDVSLIALVDIVMEWIFEGNRVSFIGALRFHSQGSNDGFVCSPRVGNQSSSIKKSRPNNVSFEVFLKSPFLKLPTHNFQIRVRIIDNLYLMETIVTPVASLSDRSVIEVKVSIVMVAKVIGGVDVAHKQKLLMTYLITGNLFYRQKQFSKHQKTNSIPKHNIITKSLIISSLQIYC